MKRMFTAIWVLILAALSAQAAYACDCAEVKPVNGSGEFSFRKWFDEFDGAVFTGRAVKVRKIKVRLDDEYVPELRVTFRVDRYWKGIDTAETVIYTGAGCCDCGVPYVQGRQYFIIAHKLEGKLRTDICTSPKRYDEVYDYIEEFGAGKQPATRKSRAKHNNGMQRTRN